MSFLHVYTRGKNTKAWSVSQYTDISKNTKAWAVSQHTKAWAVSQLTHQDLGCVTIY